MKATAREGASFTYVRVRYVSEIQHIALKANAGTPSIAREADESGECRALQRWAFKAHRFCCPHTWRASPDWRHDNLFGGPGFSRGGWSLRGLIP